MGSQHFSTPILCPSLTPASVFPSFLLACRSLLFPDSFLIRTTNQVETHCSSSANTFKPCLGDLSFLQWLCAFHHFSRLRRWLPLSALSWNRAGSALERLTQLPAPPPCNPPVCSVPWNPYSLLSCIQGAGLQTDPLSPLPKPEVIHQAFTGLDRPSWWMNQQGGGHLVSWLSSSRHLQLLSSSALLPSTSVLFTVLHWQSAPRELLFQMLSNLSILFQFSSVVTTSSQASQMQTFRQLQSCVFTLGNQTNSHSIPFFQRLPFFCHLNQPQLHSYCRALVQTWPSPKQKPVGVMRPRLIPNTCSLPLCIHD